MTTSSTKNRVIFLDLIRTLAVINMVQGHTIDVLLAESFRDYNNFFFGIWHFNRGLTAPIFLFTAGTVFTYLLKLNKLPFQNNPRVKKGFRRVLTLLFWGYILRFPSWNILNLGAASEEQWKIFFAVDVLQLIGMGLFFILVLVWLAEKTKINEYFQFSFATLLVISVYPIFNEIKWIEFMHQFFAGYFYSGTGANFPLFPWLSYIFAGAFLGLYLAKNPNIFYSYSFSLSLFIVGILFIGLAILGNQIEILLINKSLFWTTSPNLVFLRIGIVLLVNSLFTVLAMKIETIPQIIILLGRNTLIIYVVHLIILYGSPFNPGLYVIAGKSLNPLVTILSALAMIALMIGMVILLNKLNFKNKPLVTSN